MATYVEAQGSLPMPGNPAAVAAGATRQLNALNQTVLSELQNNSGRLTPENIQALIDYHRSQGTLYEVTSPGRSPKWGFAIPIVFPDGTTRYLIVEYISPGIFSGGRYVVAGVSPGSVDPRRAIEARITEPHQNSQFDNALRAFEFGMAMIPGLSDALDLGEAIFGYDWTTGDLLDAAGRMDALRAASFPGVIGLKNIETGSDLLNGLRKNPEVAPKGLGPDDMIPDGISFDIANPKYRQFKSGDDILEYTLEGSEITVDWVNGKGASSMMKSILNADGTGVTKISGYVTDKLGSASNAALQRLGDRMARELGDGWKAIIEVKGDRRFLIFTK